MSTTLDLFERLLGNGDPETVLDLADLRSARSLADRILATDPAAAREFGDAATLTGYLRSLVLPKVREARRELAARRAAPPTPAPKARLAATSPRPVPAPASEARSTQPVAVALADAPAEHWGSLESLAKVFQVGSPALRLPTAMAALRGVGIEPKDEDGAERWPLHVARRLSAAKRDGIVLAACSRLFIDSGSLIQIR